MKVAFYLLTILLLTLSSYSCRDRATETQKTLQASAEDADFKKAHATPVASNYEPKGSMQKIPVPGGADARVYALNAKQPIGKFILVFHEWWGLNEHIQKMCDQFYNSVEGNATVYGMDLYDGKVAKNQEEAAALMSAAKEERIHAIINAVLGHAGHPAQISTIGWCFGGGWSLKASILAGDQGKGCIVFYGDPVRTAAEIAPLKAELLGIWANQDSWITPVIVDRFEKLLKATGKKYTFKRFTADHAFANPSSPRYEQELAQAALDTAAVYMRRWIWE